MMSKFNYEKYNELFNKYNRIVNYISIIRLIVFIGIIISFFISSSINYYFYIALFFVLVFVVLIFVHDKYYKMFDYYSRVIKVIEKYKDRINGKWRNFDDTGEDFSNELLSDLNIVGNNSLFQYLSICKTTGGRKRLVDKLSNKKVTKKDLDKNQEMIIELSKDVSFVVDFQARMLGKCNNDIIDFDDGFIFLNQDVGCRNIDLFFGVVFSIISLSLLFLGYIKVISYNYFYGMFIFNFLINYMYSYIYSKEFSGISIVSSSYGNLYKIYESILNRKFISKKMNDIYNNINNSYESVKRLVFIDSLNNLKNNILSSFVFNGLFCVNIIVMFLYSKFQGNGIKKGIDCIYELEAMISLASIGIIRDDVCIPCYSDDVCINVSNLKHPLIDKNKCVGNSFYGNSGINIITGSNMGGKTSFLRTIGINLILMNSGTYVCADSFTSSYFKIFSSISVEDNLDKGISTFYAELLRINKALKYNEGNRLILVDEIFKGTNYNDRIYGAIEVIKKLNDNRTIAFITTHDFELCDAKGDNINNYYVKEYYENDIIKFDYKIRKGKCTSTNAKYLMKELGIIE